MPTTRLNDIDLYYELAGQGPRLLLINGSGQTLAGSALLVGAFAAHFEVASYDQRGLGRSGIPPEPYTMADYAADAAALLDELGWDTCAIAGISFGGMVAQEIAVTWPARVDRLALLCTSPGGPDASSYPLHELGELEPAERARIGIELLDSRFTPSWLESHPGDRALVEMVADRTLGDKTEEQHRGEAAQLQARRDHDVCDRLARVTCPTLVASGRFDGIAPPSNGEAIASAVSGATLRIYEGGHAFFAQDPTALPEVFTFLLGE